MRKLFLVISLVACLCITLSASEVEFNATKDSKILESDPNTNYGTDYFLGLWGGSDMPPTLDEMIMVEFFGLNELTSANGKIDNAVLRLYMTTFIDDGEALIYRIGDEWAEMDVTWNTRPDSNKSIAGNPGIILIIQAGEPRLVLSSHR